ncbi:histidine triad (HIT) protein [Chloroherpeton thalassium ATCC 35110]|uniref:Histidine triad (HIT) protein n=1 Tax=Chloroherpeton thalassium (strain ATCC 35110 / GB-78) TaxID=517418 RepID=B3QUS5_CHLT3|nr:HIT domain-containing protein [Chloroherpeton thalassium]ACF14426.1 histidine triad (HIT) protein [Chloroherpeton thalassium ATCC 35110]
MEKMFSPWRQIYMDSFKDEKPKNKQAGNKSVFADIPEEEDEERLVLYRGKKNFIIMNLYPYNCGHLLIVPYQQTPRLADLDEETRLEVMNLMDIGMKALTKVMRPHGFNMGANFGQVAGGSVDTHIHFHIVPRWEGDTNFMPLLADTKVISNDMKKAYYDLREAILEIVQ